MGATTRDVDPPPWVAWEDPEPEQTPRRRRPRWLFIAAVVPWVVAAGALWGRSGTPLPDPDASTPPAAATDADGTTDHEAGEAARRGASAHDVPDAGIGVVTASGARTAVGADEARAVALVAARRWLTTVGPALEGGDGRGRSGVYAEHLVVEDVDHPGPGAAVVTVRAVVLLTAGDTYEAAEVWRVAVPLRFDGAGAAQAATPYRLPATATPAEPLEPGPEVTDADLLLAAGEALTAAGFTDVSVATLHRTASWPLVVTATARASADGDAEEVVVWLRPHLGRLVVAGTRPAPVGTPSPVPQEATP